MPAQSPVWFITAASSGFGHETAVLALQRGHTVIATARNPSRIQDLADAGAHTFAFDVTAPLPEIEAIAKQVFDKYGRVDYLLNTAGYALEGSIEEVSPQEVYDNFNTNVFGTINTVKAFLPGLRAQPLASDGRRAVVATYGSLAGWRGAPSHGIYCMTKASCSILAETLSVELAPFDITATVVEPGSFRTAFLSPGALTASQERNPVYDDPETPTGATRRRLRARDGKQQGDVKKGSQVVVDILTQTGVAAGKPVPIRIVLGPDCEAVLREKCTESIRIVDEWKNVVRSTDHPSDQ